MAAAVVFYDSPAAVTYTEGCRPCPRKMGEKELVTTYKRFICSFPDCNANYNKDWKLQAHLFKHTGEKPFSCEYEGCTKSFARLYHLNRHFISHSGEKPSKCEFEGCGLRFSSASCMRKHFKRAHGNRQNFFVCSFADCGKEFKKHKQLKSHQYIHTNQHPFKCNHEGCDQSFPLPSKLKRHEKIHLGYPCQKDSDCEFVGKTWSELLKHLAECHLEPVVCDVCNRQFKNRSYLTDHKKIHESERIVYHCPRKDCTRTYTTKFNLQSHILSFHEDQHSFVCEHPGCGKKFSMKQSLDRHVNTHDPEKKKMVKPRPKRSLASRLSGYKPKSREEKSGSTSVTEKPTEAVKSDEALVLENLSIN